jgi:uracil-DNA glycosylase family 4
VVFGSGNAEIPDIAFVGEGPAEEEDREGLPFIGRAGRLLTKMITAMHLDRADLFVTNVVMCRPPSNREPKGDEIKACQKFLFSQLAAVRPRVIVSLGGIAAKLLTNSTKGVGELRKEWYKWEGIHLKCSWHPAFLLRQPGKKAEAWADMQSVVKMLVSLKERELEE